MNKEPVKFVASQYRGKPIKVSFYSKLPKMKKKTIKAWAVLDTKINQISEWIIGSHYAANTSYQIFPKKNIAQHFKKNQSARNEKIITVIISFSLPSPKKRKK